MCWQLDGEKQDKESQILGAFAKIQQLLKKPK